MIRHLLLIGHNLDTLVNLSIGLSGSFSTTTLATTADLAARARARDRDSFDAILILLDGTESLPSLQSLLSDTRIAFLAGESEAVIRSQLRVAGALVIAANEPPLVLAASLLALGAFHQSVATAAKSL